MYMGLRLMAPLTLLQLGRAPCLHSQRSSWTLPLPERYLNCHFGSFMDGAIEFNIIPWWIDGTASLYKKIFQLPSSDNYMTFLARSTGVFMKFIKNMSLA